MRIVFMGTGDIALPAFAGLIEKHAGLIGLVTQPDKPVGRHQVMTPPRIKTMALEAGLPVLQPECMRSPEAIESLKALDPELLVVMAYGQILPQEVIDLAPLGCVNLHASLLPKYRGASCIQAALDAGDSKTGVTLMHVVKKLDAGPIISALPIKLRGNETGEDLHDALAEVASALMLDSIPLLYHKPEGTPQNENEVSYVPKLNREDGHIDWSMSAQQIERRIRAYHPWPGTFTTYINNKGVVKKLKVFPHTEVISMEISVPPGSILHADKKGILIACGENALLINQIQPEGSKNMEVKDFLNSTSLVNQRLGQQS